MKITGTREGGEGSSLSLSERSLLGDRVNRGSQAEWDGVGLLNASPFDWLAAWIAWGPVLGSVLQGSAENLS